MSTESNTNVQQVSDTAIKAIIQSASRFIVSPPELNEGHVSDYETLYHHHLSPSPEGTIKNYLSSARGLKAKTANEVPKYGCYCGLGEYGHVEVKDSFYGYIGEDEFIISLDPSLPRGLFEDALASRDKFLAIVGTAPAKTTEFIKDELVVAVDFDGTITTQPDMGHTLVLRPFCSEVIKQLHEDGVKMVLWTCRTGSALQEAIDFLDEKGLFNCFEAVNEQLPEIVAKYPNTARKLGADIYIDDKTCTDSQVNWLETYAYLTGQRL